MEKTEFLHIWLSHKTAPANPLAIELPEFVTDLTKQGDYRTDPLRLRIQDCN